MLHIKELVISREVRGMNELEKYEQAVSVIRQAIETSRYRALKAGNAELLVLVNIFQRIHVVEHGELMLLKESQGDCNRTFQV